MAPIITVHRGELLQIKRMIEKGKGKGRLDLRGDVYGLRTESRQPVIQFVCSRDDKEQIKTLKDGHGLLKLGEWVVPRSEKRISRNDVVLEFSDKGDFITAYDIREEATLDILKGQSAFRLYKPLITPDLAPLCTDKYDKEHDELKEVQVTKEQWYSTPDGVKLLQEIYQSFQQAGIMVLNMSRDKETEDISLSLTAESTNIIVHFPPHFPYENPKVRLDDQNEWSELELQYEEEMVLEKLANLLCDSLFNFVIKENTKKQQQNHRNKNQRNGNNKQKRKANSKGDEQHPPMGKNYQQQQDEPTTGQEQLQLTGEHEQQDEPRAGQEQPPITGEHEKQRDEPPTRQEQPPITGEHEQQDEPRAGQEQPPITGEHEKQRDEPPTRQEQPPITGEHDQQDEPRAGQVQPPVTGEQDEPRAGQEPPITGEHEQQDEPRAVQEPPITGEHEQQDEPRAGQEPPITGEHEQQDEPRAGQEPPITGEHEQQDEPPIGQEQPSITGEHEQQDEPPIGQEQLPITGEHDQRDEPSPDEVINQNTGEAMDIEKQQETSEENMEVDQDDDQNEFTKF